MQNLEEEKRKIIEEKLPALRKELREQNMEILKALDKAERENKISADVKFDILQRLKIGQISFEHESSTGMSSEEKFEQAKMYFENAKMIVNSIQEDREILISEMKSIDEKIRQTEDLIQKIDENIKLSQNKDEKAELRDERGHLYTKAI